MISGIGFLRHGMLRLKEWGVLLIRLCGSLILKRTVGRSFQLFFWNLNEAIIVEEILYKNLNSKQRGVDQQCPGIFAVCTPKLLSSLTYW